MTRRQHESGLIRLDIAFDRFVALKFPHLVSLVERLRKGGPFGKDAGEAMELSKSADQQFLELLSSGAVVVVATLFDGTDPISIPLEIWKTVFFCEFAFREEKMTASWGPIFPPPYSGRLPMVEWSNVEKAATNCSDTVIPPAYAPKDQHEAIKEVIRELWPEGVPPRSTLRAQQRNQKIVGGMKAKGNRLPFDPKSQDKAIQRAISDIGDKRDM